MNNTTANFFLFFSNFYTVVVIIVFGLLLCNRSVFFQSACLAMFDIIVNVALKGTFKVPLPPELSSGYAFPSGHMQFSSVFYLWLFLCIDSVIFRSVIPILLAGIGAGLIHYHYHTFFEVLGGFGFGILLLALYLYLQKRLDRGLSWFLLTVAILLMGYNLFVYTSVPRHSWHAFFLLSGLILIERCFAEYYSAKISWFNVHPCICRKII